MATKLFRGEMDAPATNSHKDKSSEPEEKSERERAEALRMLANYLSTGETTTGPLLPNSTILFLIKKEQLVEETREQVSREGAGEIYVF